MASVKRHVWTLGDGNLYVYQENGSGSLVGSDPLFEYCYLEGVTISCKTVLQRRAITGRGRRKLVNPSNGFDEVRLVCEHIFFRKATELDLTNVFTKGKWLRLTLPLEDFGYTNVAPFENDTMTLSYCRASDFQITGREVDVIIATATFEAEMLY